MSLKQYKPVTPSQRFLVTVDRSALWKGSSVKKLTTGSVGSGGRNHNGHITSYHRGGGHKKRYRLIDFKRSLYEVPGTVTRIEYDPNRSSHIALVAYENNLLSYIIAPDHISLGDTIVAGENVDIKTGNALPLRSIPVGTLVHNVELKPGKGGQLARSAGSSAQLIKKTDTGYAMLRLASGEQRLVPLQCMATVGTVSNPDHKNMNLGKAGRLRWKGRRPVVRGVAMNPIDHPHGGGQGKTSGGRPSCTPWGIPTKGKITRSNKRTERFIVSRRKRK